MQDLIGYDEIIEIAMRSVIYETLKKIEKTGLLGKHYFVITFLTNFPGVSIPKSLLEKFHDEMTIAIQYQYKSLIVANDFFTISLSFNGKYEKLLIPYRSITSFGDPSMNFALKFSITYNDIEELEVRAHDQIIQLNKDQANKNIKKEKYALDLSAKVISIDAFRKNKNQNNDHS
jgi:hypothetical protein